jgi:negative regulator of replication initiation
MKKDDEVPDEVVDSVKETSALIREATDHFRLTLKIYTDSVVEDIRACAKRIGGGQTPEAKNELLALIGSLKEPMDAVKKHAVHMRRGLRVVNHKNAARAHNRLMIVLERMKHESQSFQEKMEDLATAKVGK